MDGDDIVTAEVCKEDDVGDGELWEVMVAGYPVLLVRNKKEFSALGSKCPHYDAPLSKGVLKGERLRCPWHGACFNIKTGDIEEYPSLDCLPCFKVTVEDGKVFVTAKKKDLESSLRVKDTRKRCLLNQDTMLLLGGGVAALACAETLRQEGFTGRIIMATKEKHVPYDKSKLSKEMSLKAEDVYLRKPEFLDARGIELWTEKEAVSVDFQKQKVHFMDRSSQKYNQLLIAIGSHSSSLKVPGADLQNVCILQTPEDSSKILELATGKNLVIIGASFIGMEVAAFLSDKAGAISVVEKREFPFQNALGPQVGGVAMKMLQNKGVKFYMKTELCELKGKDGKVTEAVLASGEKLPADVVVVGIAHANQHPKRLRCGGCGLLSCSAAQRGPVQHPSPTGGRGPRSHCCLEHAEEREGVAHCPLLLDHDAWEKHPLCRLWEGIRGHCCEGQPGATEVPDLLHQVSESVASLCPDTAAPWEQGTVLSLTACRAPAEAPHHLPRLRAAGGCWPLNQQGDGFRANRSRAGKEKRMSFDEDTSWAGSLGHISSPSTAPRLGAQLPAAPGDLPQVPVHPAVPATLPRALQNTAGLQPGCHGDAAVLSHVH
ncbi:apoptosis-inducing factor 3-like isoform 2-T2 [Spheniscus humboldti]